MNIQLTHEENPGEGRTLGFRITVAGQPVWGGRGFVSSGSRDHAIGVARRALAGLPPVFDEKAMSKEAAALLRMRISRHQRPHRDITDGGIYRIV